MASNFRGLSCPIPLKSLVCASFFQHCIAAPACGMQLAGCLAIQLPGDATGPHWLTDWLPVYTPFVQCSMRKNIVSVYIILINLGKLDIQ